MPILTAEMRRRLKDGDFALPGRRFPIPNADHAKAALSMAHNATAAEQAVIRSKVKSRYPGIDVGESKEDPKEEAKETPAQEKAEDDQEPIRKMFKKG